MKKWIVPTEKALELNYSLAAIHRARSATDDIYDYLSDRMEDVDLLWTHGDSNREVKFYVQDSPALVKLIHEFMAYHQFYPHTESQVPRIFPFND